MSKCDTVVPLICAMKKRKDIVHVAAETIKKLYDLMIPELVVQVCESACMVWESARMVCESTRMV